MSQPTLEKDAAAPMGEKVDYVSTVDAKDLPESEQSSGYDREEYLVKDYAHDVTVKVLSTQDDPTLPSFTFRFIFLGIGLSAFGSVLAQIYYFKPQTVVVARLFLLLISYFLGEMMATAIPRKGWFRYLNPGPFNIKEHTAILIMASTASVSATASEIIAVDDLYYNNTLNAGLAIFTILASQLLGYGFAGILREILVYPTATWWPTIIVSANVFQALHFDRTLSSKRVRLFWSVFAAIAVWEIVPQYMFPLLSGFSIFCLADNGRHDFMRNLFGGASNNEGTGLLALCLDFNYIAGDNLWIPLVTQLNQDVGLLLTYVFMMALYYGNVWKAKNFPFMSQGLFYINGTQYDQSLILTNNAFDAEKYAQQGPAYFSASNVNVLLSFLEPSDRFTQAWFLLVSNLALGSCIVHVLLWHWDQIVDGFKLTYLWRPSNIDDPHYNEMKKYKDVPHWWFLLVLLGSFAAAQATNYRGNSGLPWWALIVVLLMSFIFLVIYGYLASITGFQLSWFGSGFFQMIVAFMVPGKPVANMYGTVYGQHTMNQGMTLLADLKLGQYIKIPPKVTFFAQMGGAVVGSILNYIMLLQIINNNRDALLSISGTRLWSGQNPQSYNSNAISWGALGPQMFGRGGEYVMIPVALAIGIFLPIPFWLLHKRFPKFGFNYVIMPIITQYSAWLTVGINTSILSAVAMGIISQYFVRRRYPRWFTKDGGTQVMVFILSFAVFGAAGTAHNFPTWWGNPSLDQGFSADRCKAPAN
ncbi:OPT superfamily oligopeptide transporter [Vararia minispora EC-137]|uniref:OPT superfamily oligopeptide transporter n=1 Tax=Vararia minispora EC-137 TaxID=1314806 RepID=A0ACB8QA41_9AGAM|nr:OPT superfamily oligopeptide transporter [Vararia minispora EC-137]